MFDAIIDFRRRLKEGQCLFGPGIHLADPQSSDALADSSDFLWYDLEHQPMNIESLRAHLMLARHKNTPGIVRVPGPGSEILKPILDIGAHGIVVPQLKTVEQIRQVVADCRYPPQGERGFWPMIPMNYCRNSVAEVVKQSNDNLFVSVMIETAEAVEAIDEIVALEGLDSVVLGLMDLSGSYGVLGQVDHPQVVEATDKVIASARAVGMPVGTGQGTDIGILVALVDRGIQWFQTGSDCVYLVEFFERHTTELRARLAGSH